MVVGHEHVRPIFPKGYKYVTRKSEKLIALKQGFEYDFLSASFAWSEYSAFFENPDLFAKKNLTGLLHYRCFLNFFPKDIGVMPYFTRYLFLRSQSKALLCSEPYIYIGRHNQTNLGVWEQFVSHHPESEHILKLACLKYDEITSADPGDSEKRLRSLWGYIPRNIFITNTDFTNWWHDFSLSIAIELDRELVEYPDNRWGAFVLERLFSLGVQDYAEEHQIALKSFQQVYFFPFRVWIRIRLSPVKKAILKFITISK